MHLGISFEALTKAGDGGLTGTKKLYVNGVLAGTSNNAAYIPNPMHAFQIGAGQNEDILEPLHDYFFGGAVDDVAAYNYALDGMEIARAYTDVTGETVCVDDIGLQYDWNGNCIVDLEDFATFAETWLNCRIAPDCLD